VLNILKPSAFKKLITLESTIDVRYPQRFGDPKRFRQVLFNVASNAIKYTREKGSVRLFLTNSRLSCNRIEVRVEDTGVGIPSELIPHLFEVPRSPPHTTRTRTHTRC
jgi:signal transduction histidine kinase